MALLNVLTRFSELSAKSPPEALVMKFYEALRKVPCLVYLPHADKWWANADDLLKQTLLDLLSDMDPTLPLFFLATCDSKSLMDNAEEGLTSLFGHHQVVMLEAPSKEQMTEFWLQLKDQVQVCSSRVLLLIFQLPIPRVRRRDQLRPLPVARGQEPVIDGITRTEADKLRDHDEYCERKMREVIRNILFSLSKNPRYKIFFNPPDEGNVHTTSTNVPRGIPRLL